MQRLTPEEVLSNLHWEGKGKGQMQWGNDLGNFQYENIWKSENQFLFLFTIPFEGEKVLRFNLANNNSISIQEDIFYKLNLPPELHQSLQEHLELLARFIFELKKGPKLQQLELIDSKKEILILKNKNRPSTKINLNVFRTLSNELVVELNLPLVDSKRKTLRLLFWPAT